MRLLPILLLVVLVAAGCAGGDGGATADVDAVRVVSVEQAAALLDDEPAPTIIDVRTPAEFAQGHLAGATLVDYDAPDFRERIGAYDRDGSYVIYCRSGNRSAGAREVMAELGFSDVADIDGGIVAWVEQDRPVVTG